MTGWFRARAWALAAAVLAGGGLVAAPSCASPPSAAPPSAAPPVASASPVESDGGVPGRCGRERWAVKTGTDGRAPSIDVATVTDTTVGALRALPAPSPDTLSTHGFDRIAPVELAVYRVQATLTGFKREADSDYHLVLADPGGQTMIAEVPSPSCVGATSPFRAAIARARKAFDGHYPGAEQQTSFQATLQRVTVTGVGFFDFLHGQTGVAPNGIELHPVLAIEFA